MGQYFQTKTQDDVLIVTIDRQDKEFNILSEVVLRELDGILNQAAESSGLKGLIFISGKKDFIVGADIEEIQKLKTVESATEGAKALQGLFQKIASLPMSSLAAIHGSCLGGGLEMSLACTWRIATDDGGTKLGLPEIQLGLVPGAGGTQRLPRLVGIQAGLDLILTGKRVDGKKALKIGLVDACVPKGILLDEALKLVKQRRSKHAGPKRDLSTMALEGTFVGKRIMSQKARSTVQEQTKGFYPAAFKALDAVFDGIDLPLAKGLDLEARIFGNLAQTRECRSLIHLFHATTQLKKHPFKEAGTSRFGDKLKDFQNIGVVGGGFMGSGIANVCLDKGLEVAVSDPSREALGRALKSARDFFYGKVKRRRMKSFEADSRLVRLTPQLTPAGFGHVDIVIEAVFEDASLKRKILAQVEKDSSANWIFASNTSALPIAEIAAESKHKDRILGMHFFSPVEKMPLLEIVVTPETAPWATARAIELGQLMGKQVIVVKDHPGFYTTRTLAFFLAEAALLLSEGNAIEDIDTALTQFGFPVGPITLIDEVGIDVGIHVLETMSKAFPERMVVPRGLQPIVDSGRLGRKNGKGFYQYIEGKKAGPDPQVAKLVQTQNSQRSTRDQIVERCSLIFLNEACRCLEEGILQNAYDGDVGAVFGLGFPPFLGGPFKYIDTVGAANVVEKLTALAQGLGERFTPSKLLVQHAEGKKVFFPTE